MTDAVGAPSPARLAADELAALQQQVVDARATLSALQADLLDAQSRVDLNQAIQLVEANEQLVLSMLRMQVDADTAAQTLREVSRTAEIDALTGLPNRMLLMDRFAQAIATARRRRDCLAVLFVDLDRFKQINDTLGHAMGDQVLQWVAACLKSVVREADTVSRHGGDEFLILLTGINQASDAVLIADKVLSAIAMPQLFDGHSVKVSASIGISIYPLDGEDAETLIDRADAAMYRAKRYALGTYCFHHEWVQPAHGPLVARPNVPGRELGPLIQAASPTTSSSPQVLHAELQEANAMLVMAALAAQDGEATAQSTLRRQTELLTLVAHELRGPLTPIGNAATLLNHEGAGRALLTRLRLVIERQVAHMTRLVDDLLDASRVETGTLKVHRIPVELGGLVEQALDIWRPAMTLRQQQLEVNMPLRRLDMLGDSVRLVQIFSNLLANATKYTPKSGNIRLAAEATEDAVVLTVSDSGVGITPQALPTIFDPFVRESHAVSVDHAGLGIGLTVVRELVESHGGTVVAASAGQGLGSQFTVTLPLVQVADVGVLPEDGGGSEAHHGA